MEIQTILPEHISLSVQGAANGKAKLDECCKRLLSNRIILAWIMKCTMKEYRDYDPNVICSRFIEGNPVVSMTPVHQDTDGKRSREDDNHGSRIHGDNTVDESITEGRVTYDIRFRAIVPLDSEAITLIINIEAQADFWPGYPLLKRGIYYGSRLLSAQYGTDFQQSHYEKLKKVTTIWICTHPPKARCHSLSRYEMTEHNIVGNYREPADHYDLLTVILICLGTTTDQPGPGPENQIIDFLTALLSTEFDIAKKKDYLEKEYGITATKDFDKEMEQMCNYSDYVEQIGIEKGMKKGMEEGMEKGIQKGLIETCKELGVSRNATLSRLITKFTMTQAAAEELLCKYW